MKLTDEEKEYLNRITGGGIGAIDKRIYVAGIRSGLERAAKVCDKRNLKRADSPFDSEASQCAAAIRKLMEGE